MTVGRRGAEGSCALLLALGLAGSGTVAVAGSADTPEAVPPAPAPDPAPVLYQGHGARWWAGRAVHARRDANRRGQTIRRLETRERLLARRLERERRILLSAPQVAEAINLAAATYGYGSTLWRKAGCESDYDPRAANPSGASGLFQFLGSTWRSTPYGGFSVWSPYANALAAGWMHAHGRGGEWSCR